MAQVIKYQQGGSTPQKYGTFTIDGNQYQVDDDFLNQISSYGKTLDDDTAYQFSKITDALRSGANLSYDSSADKLEGVQFDVTNRQEDRLGKRRSRVGRFFGNVWRGKENTARNAVNALKGFQYRKPTEVPPNINIRDWSKDINMEYKRNKDTGDFEVVNGNKVYIGGANNLTGIKRLRSLKDIVNYGDTDQFKGYNGLEKQAYIDFYNKYGEQGIEDIISRLEQGNWTDEDAMALDDIGIFLGGNQSQAIQAQVDPQKAELEKTKQNWGKAGWDYDKYSKLFNVDESGNVTIADDEFKRIVGDNAWLNDRFRSQYGAYADYIPETSGLFVLNGKVYRGDDTDALGKIQRYLDFVKENKQTYGNSNLIRQYWADNDYSGYSNFGQNEVTGQRQFSWAFDPSTYGRDLSGEYIRNSNDPLIYEYFDQDAKFDQYGHPIRSTAKRAYIDPITKKRIDESTISNFINTLQPQTNPQFIEAYYKNNPRTAFSAYKQPYGENGPNVVTAVAGGNGNYSLEYNPETKQYYYWSDNPSTPTLSGQLNKFRDYGLNVPQDVAKLLEQNPNLIDDVNFRNDLEALLRNMYVNPGVTTRFKFSPEGNKYLGPIFQKYMKQGIGTIGNLSGLNAYRGVLNSYSTDELARAGVLLKRAVGSYQIGGKIQRKTNIAASDEAIHIPQQKVRKAGEDKVIGDSTELTTADKAELAALVADAASLGATFIPGIGNVTGAGVGAVGSLTGFGADVARDGLDWGDVGNLALNLGLDAATLLPGIGTGAKAAKMAKALKKSKAVANAVKWATRGVSFGSAASGLATAWNNIQDGKWTIKDVRTVLNGVRGFANLKRTTGSAQKKGGESDMVTLSPRSNRNLPTVKLGRSEIESINSLPKKQRTDKLEELIIGKLGKAKTDNVTDLLSEYGIKRSSNLNFNWRRPWKSSTGKGINTKQFKYDNLESSYRNPEEMGWWNWNRTAATRDAKTNRSNPYFRNYAKAKTSNVQRFFGGPQMFTPVTSYSKSPISNPIYSNMAFDLGLFSDKPQHLWYYKPENNPVFYKKGGRIVKAAGGLTFRTFSTPIDENWTNKSEHMLDKNNNIAIIPIEPVTAIGKLNTSTSSNQAPQSTQSNVVRKNYGSLVDPVKMNEINSVLGFKNRLVTKDELLNDSTASNIRGLNSTDKNTNPTTFGHGKGKGLNINPDMIMGISDFITSSLAINRSSNKMKDAIRKGMIGSQQQMPTEFYSRFSDNGLHRVYNDRIKNMRQYKTVTSDPNQVMAERLMRDMNIDQIENERDAKFSQMIDQYNDKLLAQKQQYANMRTQIANENRNRWAQGLAQLDMVDANKVTQKAQNVKNLIYQLRQDYAKDLNEKQALQGQLAQQKASGDFSNWYTNFKNSKLGEFTNWQSGEGANDEFKGWKIDDYLNYKYSGDIATNRNKFGIEALVNPYQQSQRRFWLGGNKLDATPYLVKYINPEHAPIQRYSTFSYKSGGRYLRKTDEQQYLDQQKAINKAVGELNNNIIKLFLKMMS